MIYRNVTSAVMIGALTAPFGATFALGANPATRFLVVRYDDYFPRRPAPEKKGIELEAKLFALFQKHDARLLVGAVPFPTDHGASSRRDYDAAPEAVAWLKDTNEPWLALLRRYVELGVIEVALHGHSHWNRTPPGHRSGEFVGQPYEWQYDAVRAGRDALAGAIGRPVRTFIPPWNAWDEATTRALETLGFQWCSADLHHADAGSSNLRFLPQCSWRPREVLEFIRTADTVPRGSIIVLVLHPFDFEGPKGEERFAALDELLAFAHSDPTWASVGLDGLPSASPVEWKGRFRQTVALEHSKDFLADCWGPSLMLNIAPSLYLPRDYLSPRLWRWQAAVAATLTISGVAALVVAAAAGRRLLRSRRWIVLAAVVGAISGVAWTWGAVDNVQRGYGVRGLRWQAIIVASGATAGFCWSARRAGWTPNVAQVAEQIARDGLPLGESSAPPDPTVAEPGGSTDAPSAGREASNPAGLAASPNPKFVRGSA